MRGRPWGVNGAPGRPRARTNNTGSVRSERVKAPGARNALEVLLAPILELDARACDQVLDSARHEDFAGLSQGRDAGTDRDGNVNGLAVADLQLAGMETSPDLEADGPQRLAKGGRRLDAARGSIEGREEPVTGRVG